MGNTFFFKCNSVSFFYNTSAHYNMCCFCIPRGVLVINVCNQGKTLCSPCISYEVRCLYIT